MKVYKLKRAMPLGLVVLLIAGMAGLAEAKKEKMTIRLASPFKAGHILCDAGEKFKELVDKASGGEIEVQVRPGSGSEEEINEWCSKGTVESRRQGEGRLKSLRRSISFSMHHTS